MLIKVIFPKTQNSRAIRAILRFLKYNFIERAIRAILRFWKYNFNEHAICVILRFLGIYLY